MIKELHDHDRENQEWRVQAVTPAYIVTDSSMVFKIDEKVNTSAESLMALTVHGVESHKVFDNVDQSK